MQAPPRQKPKTIENMRVADETIVDPEDEEVNFPRRSVSEWRGAWWSYSGVGWWTDWWDGSILWPEADSQSFDHNLSKMHSGINVSTVVPACFLVYIPYFVSSFLFLPIFLLPAFVCLSLLCNCGSDSLSVCLSASVFVCQSAWCLRVWCCASGWVTGVSR